MDELARAGAYLLSGQMAFASGHSTDSPSLLLEAARRFETLDARLARETYLDALSAAMYVGRLAGALKRQSRSSGLKAPQAHPACVGPRNRGALACAAQRATGETARKRTVATMLELTIQETQIARLAREGLSNFEIGTRLFLSPRTVQYHPGKVFTKLGIASRSQLRAILPANPYAAAQG